MSDKQIENNEILAHILTIEAILSKVFGVTPGTCERVLIKSREIIEKNLGGELNNE